MRPANAAGSGQEKTDKAALGRVAGGVAEGGSAIPFWATIQRSFGRHDISQAKASIGGSAKESAEKMGANAIASGSQVCFAEMPDLFTAAHEAAHLIQQRGGVCLDGGVGQKGDAHEQNADAVAECVVAGRSAESLLDRYVQSSGAGSALGAARSEGVVQCDENDKQLEDALDAVAGAYKWICLKQSNAVNDLSIDAGQKDPPSFWESALWACADVALALALGGVGGLVAAKVLKKLAEAGIPDLTAKIVADGVKDASKATAKSLLGGMKHGASTKNQRELFFRSQRDVLQDTAKMDEEEFIVSGKHKIRQAKQPYKQAVLLRESLNENYASAYAEQQRQTLDAWCVYQARAALNDKSKGSDEGTELGKQLGDTSEAGVLGIVIRVDRPGAKPKVERAEIEGLNEGLRSLIENRPIGSLRMPITVKGEVGEDIGFARWFFGHESQPTIAVGRNEQGDIWADGSMLGLHWLRQRGVPHVQQAWDGQGNIHDIFPAGAEFTGARLLIEQDMKDIKVGDKLSG